jgi:SecD/SecF fusion protein
MSDPNRLLKWVLVIGLVAISLVILYPPQEKLKGGIDLVGGTSLLFEIDTSGLEPTQQRGLSTKVMGILKDRVDPQGQLNLEWRTVGNTRLEIRMPRPPKEALARRQVYNAAVDELRAMSLRRFEVETALHAPANERETALDSLVHGVKEREPVLAALAARYDEYTSAQQVGDTPTTEAASAKYEKAMADLLATSMHINRATDVFGLPLGARRQAELDKLRTEFPSYDAEPAKPLTKVVEAYDAWAKRKANLEDPSDLKRRLKGSGVLEFRILAERDPSDPTNKTRAPDPQLAQPINKYTEQLAKYGPRPKAGDQYQWFPVDNVLDFMHLSDISEFESQKSSAGQPIVEEYAGRYYALVHSGAEYGLVKGQKAWSLREAFPNRDPLTGRNVVSFALDPRGGQMFGELTEKNLQRSLCIMLDNTATSHAVIQSRITTHGQIFGNFTVEKVQDLVRTLEAGSLPARLKDTPLMENTIGPSLGETNRQRGFAASMWGGSAVLVFMILYYGFAGGGIADLALALNVLFVLAVMALLQATFTLPGIAGLVLTVGMAVDANVLIFERFREERARGVIFKKAINAGYDKAFSAIFDSNLTTLITCVILGFVGSEEIKGFAITLGIGLSVSMFTALVVTRLIFNTLIAKGWLRDLSMRSVIGVPQIDWMGLCRVFLPASMVAGVLGIALFLGLCIAYPDRMFDIEFLGGTSLQIDLKPGVAMTDEEMRRAITTDREGAAVGWLGKAAGRLDAAQATLAEGPGQFALTSPGSDLTGDQLGVLMRQAIEDKLERNGVKTVADAAVFTSKPDTLTLEGFKQAVAKAAQHVRDAANRLKGGRVQSIGAAEAGQGGRLSYEIVTVETDRELIQAAIIAALGDKLAVQKRIAFTTIVDDVLTKGPYFVVESNDHYLSDVIGGDATFDVRRFRGGVAVEVVLDDAEEPLAVDEFERRLREVGLQPEFEQYRTRDSAVFPLGAAERSAQGPLSRFAVVAVDESLLYDDDQTHERWTADVAETHLHQVEAALGQEKSLSKVIQFAAPIAVQTQNRAVFAIILSLVAIAAYLWFRFGTKEWGLAATVALGFDVGVTLGLLALCHYLAGTVVGNVLLLDAFRIDVSLIGAVLTVIGYSINDKIVVFDRIRENKGRVESLNLRIINSSISQVLSRTLLTGCCTIAVLFILYLLGGEGVHGFSFVMLLGVVIGTYSSIAVAIPLLYRTKLLHATVAIIIALSVIGLIFAATDGQVMRLVLSGLTVVVCGVVLVRLQRGPGYVPAGKPVGA